MDQKIDPFRLALWVFAGTLAVQALAWVVVKMHIWAGEPLFAWNLATAFLLFFGVADAVKSFAADNPLQFWGRSMYAYLGLAAANGLVAWAISGVSIGEAGSYKWLYLVVTIGFLVFISLVNAVRKIVHFAEREDWQQPRQRKEK